MLSRPPAPSTASEASPPRPGAKAPGDVAHRLVPGESQEPGAPTSTRLTVELGAELAEQLHRLARAQGEPTESVAADLLRLGLQHDRRRQQAEGALAGLTPRQREVARLAAGGRTNRQIARELWLSPETVKTHLRRTLERFDLHSKAELRLLLLGLDGDCEARLPVE